MKGDLCKASVCRDCRTKAAAQINLNCTIRVNLVNNPTSSPSGTESEIGGGTSSVINLCDWDGLRNSNALKRRWLSGNQHSRMRHQIVNAAASVFSMGSPDMKPVISIGWAD